MSIQFGFHAVRHTRHRAECSATRCVCDKRSVSDRYGYEVWCNNRPVITLDDGLLLHQSEANALVAAFNGESRV